MAKQKSTIPTGYGWYVSQKDYHELFGNTPQDVPIYLNHTKENQWFKNGQPVQIEQIPDDLWPIRHVMR